MSSHSPFISILLPVFNAQKTLAASLDSLLAQDSGNFEIVAVDDGSTDASASILENFSIADQRLRVVHTKHSGIVAALERARRVASGALLARMDADDLCPPDRLRLQTAYLEAHPEVDVCSCLVGPVPGETLAGGYRHYLEWINSLVTHEEIFLARFTESPIPHPSAMIRNESLDKIGGYRQVDWPEDYDLWLRMAQAGMRFGKVEKTLLYWRDHDQRLSRTDSRYCDDAFARAKAYYLKEGPLSNAGEVICWGAGRTTRQRAAHLEENGVRIMAWVDVDPRKIGNFIGDAPVISPEALAGYPDTIVLAWVSARGARTLIAERLVSMGRTEGVSFFICG